LQEKRNMLRHVEWIIIDEISMVSYQTLLNIDSRLRDIFSLDEPFAGKNVLLFGDLLQLKPVFGNWCFQRYTKIQHETDLWTLFTIFELTTVLRQRNDNVFKNVLGKLRTGDLLPGDLAPLEDRVLRQSNPRYAELLQIANESLHIYPLCNQVDNYNRTKMEELRSKGSRIYTFNCIDKIADSERHGAIAPAAYIPRDDRNCGGIPRQLQIAVGCRIMLRRNISADGGLVNGSMGTVRRIGWDVRRDGPLVEGEQPQYIAVQFDDSVAAHLLDDDGYYRVLPNSFEFEGTLIHFVKRYIAYFLHSSIHSTYLNCFELIGNYKHLISRIQFPIVLCYACTVHKVFYIESKGL